MSSFTKTLAIALCLAMSAAAAPPALAQVNNNRAQSNIPDGGSDGPSPNEPSYDCLIGRGPCAPRIYATEGCERTRVREWIDARHYRWVYRCAERFVR